MISMRDVSFSYDGRPFIQDVTFSVAKGEVFGFLGPSGAGKSTLQKILTGVLSLWKGEVSVCGTDMRKKTRAFYERIGVDFEFPSLYEKLTAAENLAFFSSLYRKKRYSVAEALDLVSLGRDAGKKVGEFSKGMKSRLNFAKALMHDPEALFLDEPTSGLDPVNARAMKDVIRAERDRGKAVILTTHNMHDAAELCDRVAFIVDGTVRALDSPRNLSLERGAARIAYSSEENGREVRREIELSRTGEDELLASLIREGKLLSIHSMEPTLEDIFVEVTGRSLS